LSGRPFAAGSALARLLDAPVRPGRVEWLGLRPLRHAPLAEVAEAELSPEEGLLGDHYRSRTTGARHLTLIGAEDLAAIAAHLGREAVTPGELRRNVVTRGINLLALKDRRFRLGSAMLETTGECHPCSRMELILGDGGYNAVRGHGGITARVLEGGTVRVGDAVARLD
jgi:MOSC domain-containing protein YiiM